MTFHPPSEERARYARLGTTTVLVMVFLLSLGFVTAEAAWEGRSVEENGVTLVENSDKAIEAPRTVELEELWRLGGNSEDEDEFFGVITKVMEDEAGNFYVLDQILSEVKVFDREGNYLRTIGREGEGPGEFRNPADMVLLPDGHVGVLQQAPGKIVRLTREGEPAGEHPIPEIEGAGFIMIFSARSNGDLVHLVFGHNNFEEGFFTQIRHLARLNPDGSIDVDYLQVPRTIDFSDPVVEEKIWDGVENRWALGSDGRVYAAETWGRYAVTVWSPEGVKERVITRELENRKRSQKEKDRLAAIYEPFIQTVPGGRPGIEKHDHPISQVHVRENGSLWVMNCFGAFDRPEGSLGVFDVFDADGRFQRQVTLMGDGDPLMDAYLIQGDKLYVLTGFMDAAMSAAGGASDEATDEDAEPMAVICYDLSGTDLALFD